MAPASDRGPVGVPRDSLQPCTRRKNEALWIEAIGSDGTEAFEGLVNFVPEVIASSPVRARPLAGRRIIPVVEGPHRHGASHGGRGPDTPALSPGCGPVLGQRPIDRRGTHRQQTCPNDGVKHEMSVPLHGLDQRRQQHLEALATDPVTRLPGRNQGLADSLVVGAAARPWPRSRNRCFPSQKRAACLR